MPSRAFWVRSLVAIAAAKILVGLTAAGIAALAAAPIPIARLALLVTTVVVFAAAGTVLLAGGARDPRAVTLGALFLAIASVFADPLFGRVGSGAGALLAMARAVMALQVDAFTPYLLWRFALEFPRVPDIRTERRFSRAALRVSFAIGTVLLVANVLLFASRWLPQFSLLAALSRWNDTGAYWRLVLGASLPVLPIMLWKAQYASAEERRRVALLVAGLGVGLVPTILWVFLQSVWPLVGRVLPLRVAGWVIYPTLLSAPLSTAYAVLVRRALDVRVVIRRALQYALARYSAMVVAAIPVVLLCASVYRRRDQSVATLLSTPSQLLLGLIAILGLITLRRRNEVLARIDRLFFREQYDTERILGDLVNRCRATEDGRHLAETLRSTIDSVLHLDHVAVLFLDADEQSLMSPHGEIRPIRVDSTLAELVADREYGLDVDLERYNRLFRDVPEQELHWIVDGGFRLLLALRDADRRLIGLLALGEKKSELPFSAEDQRLLAGVASAAEMTMAYRNLRPRYLDDGALLSISSVAEQRAAECRACGSVQPRGQANCVRCGGVTADCVLPQVIGGKFLIDERIGAGAMGVVYRGMDVHLGRLVAIKTLPHLSPGDAVRLRREARAMASVSHRNLATIFGAETWQGQPMLVCEYLAGGTLAHRLERGPLPIHEVIEIGLALTSVLAAVHRAGVLHRDIKPSNIGFSADGTPKLLDFGIARILTVLSAPASSANADLTGMSDEELALTVATESAIRGTPLYMSPEALRAAPPDATFDLWSLALVLYEAAAGRHPLLAESDTSGERPYRRNVDVPDIRDFIAAMSADVAAFFRRALTSRREDRPQSADELHAMLAALSSRFTNDSAPVPASAVVLPATPSGERKVLG